MSFEPDEKVKQWADWHYGAHGWTPLHPYLKCLECKDPLHLMEVYRCFDCDAPMHKGCLIRHCEVSKQLWPSYAENRKPSHIEPWALHRFGNDLTAQERAQVIALLTQMDTEKLGDGILGG